MGAEVGFEPTTNAVWGRWATAALLCDIWAILQTATVCPQLESLPLAIQPEGFLFPTHNAKWFLLPHSSQMVYLSPLR